MTESKEHNLSPICSHTYAKSPHQSDKTPHVSVIIPTHNAGKYLGQALDSLFAQDYDSYEVVVVDDGSTDDTPKVLQTYIGRLRCHRQENAGSAVARNTGLTLARGKYIVFLDADDLLLPGKLEGQAALLDARPSLGAVHSGWYIMNEAGERLRYVEPWQWAPVLDLDTWIRYQPVMLGAMMFRRSWIDRIGGFDPHFRQAQDTDLLLRLSLHGCEMEWIRQPTACYRTYPDSTIRQNSLEHSRYSLGVLDKFFSDPRVPSRIKKQQNEYYYRKYIWLSWQAYSCSDQRGMSHFLREAFSYSPRHPTRTVFEILEVYVRNLRNGEKDVEYLRQIWPRLGQVSGLEGEALLLVDRYFQWWLSHKQSLKKWKFDNLSLLWPYFQAAVRQENKQSISPEKCLDWWATVWWYEVNGHKRKGRAALATRFTHLSAQKLVAHIQLSLVIAFEETSLDQLEQFWDQTIRLDLIPKSHYPAITGIYLTYLGQSIMRHEWGLAKRALHSAIRVGGFHPQALLAWRNFVRKAFSYAI